MARLFLLVGVAIAADWEWVDIEGSECIGGQQTGVYVRRGGGKNLGVYLYGGGACFNLETCAVAVTTDPHPGNPGTNGIFDSRSDNPLVGYNWMAVPYCTGDVHAGDIDHRFSGKERHFAGARNLKLMMSYATQQFTDVEQIFITGESAGGFGAAASYATIRDFYPSARGVLMDDSGPILDDDALPACLQKKWRNAWDLNKNMPSDCPCNTDSGNLVSIWDYAKARYPEDSFSLVSSQTDSVISTFFAYGNNNCFDIVPINYHKLYAGLQRVSNRTSVYMIPGSVHTHTSSGEFYSRSVDGVSLFKWIEQLMDPHQPDPDSVEPTSEDILREMFPTSASEGALV